MIPGVNPRSTRQIVDEIDLLIRARYPVLYLLTHEETRVEYLLQQMAQRQGKLFFTWTATRGLIQHKSAGAQQAVQGDHREPIEMLRQIEQRDVSAIFVLFDFHPYLNDPLIVRTLREAAHALKNTYKNIVVVSPSLNLPNELDKEITLIDFPLPDMEELTSLLRSVCRAIWTKNKNAVNLSNEDASQLVRAAQGLTLTEAENAFAKAAVSDGVLDIKDVDLVLTEKKQIIRKSGILEFYPGESSLNDIGGLAHLKAWLNVRGKGFDPGAREFGLPAPKGVLLLGAPGCGKSLMAKAVSNAWNLPLLRLDLGRIFSGLLGSSEENMRKALKVAEGAAPAILWIDEIEKGLAGSTSGFSDGGAAARVFGALLTWMQEKTSQVFVVATANKIEILPPELMRRGRFDEIFFVDLPDNPARREVLSIHLRKRGKDPAQFDLTAMADATDGFSGAELEHCVVEGMFHAFHDQRPLDTKDVLKAAAETVPLSVTYAEELDRARDWAATRARLADTPSSGHTDG